MEKIHIERNTVQETLIIPLFARYQGSLIYPELCKDDTLKPLIDSLDYDFSNYDNTLDSAAGRFGALEVLTREYAMVCEIEAYLQTYPGAAVVNLGCGLLDFGPRIRNKNCHIYNVDFPDVIEVRRQLIPEKENVTCIGTDLNDQSWFTGIEKENGAIFVACGVFYYFTNEQMRKLLSGMAAYFPDGIVCFDECNRTGVKMMTKKWIKKAANIDVNALFAVSNAKKEIGPWSPNFRNVSAKPYMEGYSDEYKKHGMMSRILSVVGDRMMKMQIVKIEFR